MDIRFSFRHLQLFAAIARTGSVSAAAAELAMSQSAASTALIELENRYQRPLFERIGKRLRLSEAGHLLVPLAVEILDRAAEASALLRGQAGAGPIRIGATQTIGTYLAPRLIAAYRLQYPSSVIALEIANTSAIALGVADFSLDLGLIEGEQSDARLAVTDWLDDALVLICRPSHRLAARPSCTAEDVLAEQWVVRERGSGTRQALDRAMAPLWDRWTIAIELQQAQAIVELVAASALIGCVSRLAAEASIALGLVVPIAVPELDLARCFSIIRHRDRFETQAMTAMLALCTEMKAGPVTTSSPRSAR